MINPPPSIGLARAGKPITPPPAPPAGWWAIHGVQGTRQGVITAIHANEKVPDFWRAAITMEINKLDGKFNFVKVDAHFHIHEGKSSLHLSITPTAGLA